MDDNPFEVTEKQIHSLPEFSGPTNSEVEDCASVEEIDYGD